MRSFITEAKPGLLKQTDYVLSRQYGILSRTKYIDTTTTDSTQSQVNAESKYDNARDKHGIYAAMIYEDHYQLDFPCYESCLLFKVTFQVMAPFDAGTKIGIFNDKAPVVILDMHNPDTAASEYDYFAEITANATSEQNIPHTLFESSFDANYEHIIIPSTYNAKNTDFTSAEDDPYGRTKNVMPDVNHPNINVGDVFKFTGANYSYEYYVDGQLIATWQFKTGVYYIVSIIDGNRWWIPAYLSDTIGYEYYFVSDNTGSSRVMPRIINVDPYETDDGELIPIQLHARVIGNETKSSFGYLTIETYPIIRK